MIRYVNLGEMKKHWWPEIHQMTVYNNDSYIVGNDVHTILQFSYSL